MRRVIKTYEQFAPNPLALPPHIPEDNEKPEGNKLVMTLKETHELEHQDIVQTGNRINSLIEMGAYLKVKDVKANFFFINQNEPIILFGIKAGQTFSFGKKEVKADDDSIVIISKSEGTMFVLSVKDSFEFTYVRPKIIISQHDPYGEEDWGEEE